MLDLKAEIETIGKKYRDFPDYGDPFARPLMLYIDKVGFDNFCSQYDNGTLPTYIQDILSSSKKKAKMEELFFLHLIDQLLKH